MVRSAERRTRGRSWGEWAWALLALGLGLLAPTVAPALEAFDGRIQVHGFAEMQLRALDEHFEEQLDLAQWYNILNVELEFDILPDGWGPIDLLQAYVRLEGRYDCVWSRGCGMFRSVNTYGDDAQRLGPVLQLGRGRRSGRELHRHQRDLWRSAGDGGWHQHRRCSVSR